MRTALVLAVAIAGLAPIAACSRSEGPQASRAAADMHAAGDSTREAADHVGDALDHAGDAAARDADKAAEDARRDADKAGVATGNALQRAGADVKDDARR